MTQEFPEDDVAGRRHRLAAALSEQHAKAPARRPDGTAVGDNGAQAAAQRLADRFTSSHSEAAPDDADDAPDGPEAA